MAKDIIGKTVRVGAKVKVLSIAPSILESLPDEEIKDVQSMIGEVLEVCEVNESSVVVEKWWDEGNGHSYCHCVNLSPSEIELIIGQ